VLGIRRGAVVVDCGAILGRWDMCCLRRVGGAVVGDVGAVDVRGSCVRVGWGSARGCVVLVCHFDLRIVEEVEIRRRIEAFD